MQPVKECLWHTMLVEDMRQCILDLLDPLARLLMSLTSQADYARPRPPTHHFMDMEELIFRYSKSYFIQRSFKSMLSHARRMSGLPGAYAAHQGNLELLKWMHTEKYAIYSITVDYAASGGQLRVLHWLQDIGRLSWTSQTMQQAVGKHASVPLLEWMVRNGCPEPHIQSVAAVRGGHLDVLKWLHARGHEMHDKNHLIDEAGGREDVIQWLNEFASPRPTFWCQNDIAQFVALPDTNDDDI